MGLIGWSVQFLKECNPQGFAVVGTVTREMFALRNRPWPFHPCYFALPSDMKTSAAAAAARGLKIKLLLSFLPPPPPPPPPPPSILTFLLLAAQQHKSSFLHRSTSCQRENNFHPHANWALHRRAAFGVGLEPFFRMFLSSVPCCCCCCCCSFCHVAEPEADIFPVRMLPRPRLSKELILLCARVVYCSDLKVNS
jgi:hypothetical protein